MVPIIGALRSHLRGVRVRVRRERRFSTRASLFGTSDKDVIKNISFTKFAQWTQRWPGTSNLKESQDTSDNRTSSFCQQILSTYCECYFTACNWFQQEGTAERREQRDDNVDFEPYNLTVEFWTYHFRTRESASSFHSAQCAIKSANLLFLLNKSISQTHPLQLLVDLTCLIEIKW